MAVIGRKASCHFPPMNKEPDWSSICNNVFDQYLEDADIFAVDAEQHERSSSGNSGNSANLLDSSNSSKQSKPTAGFSPLPSWVVAPLSEETASEAKQPKAKAPRGFWTKKLRALEQNAAQCEARQVKLRTAKSQPEFPKLGSLLPNLPMPSSPDNQSFSSQRSRSRTSTANGKTAVAQRGATNSRSVSRGRGVGVMKSPPTFGAISTYATLRKSNASPARMMSPSRYRAAFKDVWAERIEHSPKKYELRLPSSSQTFPESPPPSARSLQESLAAFSPPIASHPSLRLNDQSSPRANVLQEAARLCTPINSPLLSPRIHAVSSYFDPVPPLPANLYTTQKVPLNDTAPLYPDTNSLSANKTQPLDFGFSSSPLDNIWSAAPFIEPAATSFGSDVFCAGDSYGNPCTHTSAENLDFGLGISCENSGIANYTTVPSNALLLSTTYQPSQMSPTSSLYVPGQPNSLPIMRTRQPTAVPSTPRHRPSSPSPSPPATNPRSRRASASSRGARHRRTKSSNSTPRHAHSANKADFVNFTPQDSNKILSGVAPSGSSKTKARREKEAADKRRRLSQAAIRAVLEAGGNVEELEKAGFILP